MTGSDGADGIHANEESAVDDNKHYYGVQSHPLGSEPMLTSYFVNPDLRRWLGAKTGGSGDLIRARRYAAMRRRARFVGEGRRDGEF